MDPFNQYNIKKIWHALERCGMKESVEAFLVGLYEHVVEYGNNFSHRISVSATIKIRNNEILLN